MEIITNVPLHLIDEPEHAMRSDAWDNAVDELAQSIKRIGLIQPLTVRRKGERYEVVAGHRRLAAIRMIGWPSAPSIVLEIDDVRTDIIRFHENLKRRDVDPVDQARFLDRLMKAANLSISEVAKEVGWSESTVRARLEVLSYPGYLVTYIQEGRLSQGAAQELFRIKSEKVREDYCRIGAQQGVSASRARIWMKQANVAIEMSERTGEQLPTTPSGDGERVVIEDVCVFCLAKDDVRNLRVGSFHAKCATEYMEVFSSTEEPHPEG